MKLDRTSQPYFIKLRSHPIDRQNIYKFLHSQFSLLLANFGTTKQECPKDDRAVEVIFHQVRSRPLIQKAE